MKIKGFLEKKIGIIGGGQLGKMLLDVTNRMSIDTYILDPSKNCPCSRCIPNDNFTQGELMDFETVYNFGISNDLDIISTEIEHINTKALKKLRSKGIKVYPYPETLEIIQNKNTQKDFFISNLIPTAKKKKFNKISDIKQSINDSEIKLPFVLKSCTHGYDGRGVQIIKDTKSLDDIKQGEFIAEDMVDIHKEISIIVARNVSKQTKTYFPIEMYFDQDSNQLNHTIYPANIDDKIVKESQRIANILAEKLDLVGVMAIEMFIDKNGNLLVNELAPRPHNSGHSTIENSYTSQFEQHIRAILNLPLGNTEHILNSFMINIVGKKNYKGKPVYKEVQQIIGMENTYIHIYGKEQSFPNRKMGHITLVDTEIKNLNSKLNKINKLANIKENAKGKLVTDSDDYYNRGIEKRKLGLYKEAILDYDKAINLDPNNSAVYNSRGIAKANLKLYKEAILDYDKAIELDPNNSEDYYNRAIAKDDLGLYKEAILDYDNAINLDPNDSDAYYNRGIAKANLKLYKEAILDYDKAIELYPNDSDSYYNRGIEKANLKQYKEAILDYDKAIELDPNDYDSDAYYAYCSRGEAKYSLGLYKEAIQDYDNAIELYPNNPLAYDNREIAREKLGQ